jgi:hypothetical protein
MEAGFFGIPTVSSPLSDAVRFAGEGVLFATTPEHWIYALETLAGQFPYSMEWRESLRERILRNASVENEAERWCAWLKIKHDNAKRSRESSPAPDSASDLGL